MKPILILGVFAISCYFLLESCGSTKLIPSCATENNEISYASVKPIIDAKCTRCHGGFDSYTGIKKYLENGKFEKLVLVKQTMPRGENLTQDEINKVLCWKNSGFKE